MGWGTKKKRRNDVRVIVGGQKDHEKYSFFELKGGFFFYFLALSQNSHFLVLFYVCAFLRGFFSKSLKDGFFLENWMGFWGWRKRLGGFWNLFWWGWGMGKERRGSRRLRFGKKVWR